MTFLPKKFQGSLQIGITYDLFFVKLKLGQKKIFFFKIPIFKFQKSLSKIKIQKRNSSPNKSRQSVSSKDAFQANNTRDMEVPLKSRKINKNMMSLDRKAYDLAKGFEKQYNNLDQSPALQKYYLSGKKQGFSKGFKYWNRLGSK